MLYGTTQKFMEYFGINDLVDLPAPKEFTSENTIGENEENIAEPEPSNDSGNSSDNEPEIKEPDGQA
jgi:segregation and condensation protein B